MYLMKLFLYKVFVFCRMHSGIFEISLDHIKLLIRLSLQPKFPKEIEYLSGMNFALWKMVLRIL